jgi:ubiquitin-like modifier-activating enzyme ATG7
MKYAPLESAIDLPFYYSLAQHKIDYDKLDDSPRKVLGQYVPRDGQRLQVQGNALIADEFVAFFFFSSPFPLGEGWWGIVR